MCEKIWRTEQIPEECTKGIIHPIFKEGDEQDTANYRGITLTSSIGKVFTQILFKRIMTWVEQHQRIEEEQGFRFFRGCQDNLFITEIIKNRDKKEHFVRFWM